MTPLKRNCAECGKEYTPDSSNLKKGLGITCSKSCGAKRREKLRIGYDYTAAQEDKTKIILHNGMECLVDEEDYDKLISHRWFAYKGHGTYYAHKYAKGEGTRIMHRIIMGVTDPLVFVDHRNGNGLDNRKLNLRIATKSQNAVNSRKFPGTSQYRGVHFNKRENKWQAVVCLNNKNIRLGTFPGTPEGEIAAAKVRDQGALKYHGEFARLNFPSK